MTNATFSVSKADRATMVSGGLGKMPNGIIKAIVSFHDDFDEKLLELMFYLELNYHHNSNGNDF